MSDTLIMIAGTVEQVQRSTQGYGDTERSVGFDVTVKSHWFEEDETRYTRETKIHLPNGYRQPLVGDKVTIVFNRGTEIPVVVDNDDDDDIQGHPDYDSIKQGG